MNKTASEALDFCKELASKNMSNAKDVAVLVPFTDLKETKEGLGGSGIGFGAQNVHFEESGAFTGEVSVPMLKELGITHCIVGHSERREYFNETDETCNLKLKKIFADSEITPILCVGENLEQREAGKAAEIVEGQIEADLAGLSAADVAKLVIAYEPIWAIGTGKTATPEQAGEMCTLIREKVQALYDEDTCDQVIIQYGGSVKPENATDIMANGDVDGALVGGASLVPEKFMGIINF